MSIKKHNNQKPSQEIRLDLSAVAYQEDGVWFAHCLELDIVGDGDDPHSAMKNLIDLTLAQLECALSEDNLDQIFRPAPPEIFWMYSRGKNERFVRKPTIKDHLTIESFRQRRLVTA